MHLGRPSMFPGEPELVAKREVVTWLKPCDPEHESGACTSCDRIVSRIMENNAYLTDREGRAKMSSETSAKPIRPGRQNRESQAKKFYLHLMVFLPPFCTTHYIMPRYSRSRHCDIPSYQHINISTCLVAMLMSPNLLISAGKLSLSRPITSLLPPHRMIYKLIHEPAHWKYRVPESVLGKELRGDLVVRPIRGNFVIKNRLVFPGCSLAKTWKFGQHEI